MKKWQEVKREIDMETKKIWLNEPEEVTKCKNGIFPSGAGSYGQYFSNLVFINGDLRALATWITPSVVLWALESPDFTLDQCKELFKRLTITNGAVDFLAYVNLKKLRDFTYAVVDSYDSIKTKEEFKELLKSWYNYANRLYFWFHHNFPFGIGAVFPRKTSEEIKKLVSML